SKELIMSWPSSVISSNWGTTTAMAANGENFVVFGDNTWEVKPNGDYTQIKSDWPKTVAATTNGNFIYAIRPEGYIYNIRTTSYTDVFK
ncbi:10651_t:CDS:1, partial [Racocetra fulgida]